MRRKGLKAEAEVDVILRSRRELHAIAIALVPETMHPAGERAQATVTVRGRVLRVKFKAQDSSALRAILVSYLRLLKATTNVCTSLLNQEHRRTNRAVSK